MAECNGLPCLSCRCGDCDLIPDREAVGHLGSPLGRADQMTTGPKVLSDSVERKQEPLRLPRRGEAFHHPFPDPGRLMGVLGPVVEVLRAAVGSPTAKARGGRPDSWPACR